MTRRGKGGIAPQEPSAAIDGPLGDRGVAAVLRLLRGEPLHVVAEELGVTTAELLRWRDAFLAGGRERLTRLSLVEPITPIRPHSIRGRTGSSRRRLARGARIEVILGVLVLLGVAATLVVLSARGSDDISRGWSVVHDGYGKVGVEKTETGQTVHFLKPMISQSPAETHGALVTSDKAYDNLDLTLRVRTVQQLRVGSPPQPWETAWIAWHYTDDRHFYYVTLKPNGWEIGKRDPAYAGGQRFLASDLTPRFYLTEWYSVRVLQEGTTLSVWVDGILLTRFVDDERPYLQGRVGLYTEDAYAQFADVRPTGSQGATPTR